MKYCEIPPPGALAMQIECFWLLQSNGSQAAPVPQRILPDGCVEMILNFAEPFAERGPRGFQRQPLHFVVGQMESPKEIVPTGRMDLIGIRFHPAGARKVLGIPMRELTERLIPLELLHRELNATVQAVGNADGVRAKLGILQDGLRRRVAHGSESDRVVRSASRRLMESDGCVSIRELTTQCGVSRRQLERKFSEWVGLTPKTLGRILRFQRVFKALESGGANWADVAACCGYYDQSHLIRDFRQFAGGCPSALEIPGDSLTEKFMRKNRTSHFSKTPD